MLAAASAPAMLAVWALWGDLWLLEADGLRWLGGGQAAARWAALSAVTVALVVLFWLPSRALRVLGYTFYSLDLAVAFGVAGVLAVLHAFGGPDGNLDAPAWAIAGLAAAASLCVVSLLATAALIVEDVRGGDADEEAATAVGR